MDQEMNINPPRRIQNAAIVALALLSLFLLAKTLTEFKKYPNAGSEYGQNIISVSGKGEVFATADVATFSFSVMEEGSTVAEAQKKATEKNNNAIKLLKDNGVEEKDIQTTGYNVNPKYDYNNSMRPCTQFGCPPSTPKLVGYEINQSVTVKVRDIAKAGDLLTKIGATGVSNISGLSFTIDDEESLKAEARSKAIADAREKAKKLAKDLGVKLGDVTSFYENTDPGYPIYGKMESMAVGMGGAVNQVAPAPDIATGENKITINVNISYRIR